MAFKFDFGSVFTSDGLAKSSEADSPDSKRKGITFQLTQADTERSKKPKERESRHLFALTIEECKPAQDYRVGEYTPLPTNVSFERIAVHVIDSFKNAFQKLHNNKLQKTKKRFQQNKLGARYDYAGRAQTKETLASKTLCELIEEKEEILVSRLMEEEETSSKKLESKLKVWKNYFSMRENEAIISDAFWYIRYKLVPEDHSEKIRSFLLERLSKNYVRFFVETSGPLKDAFFRNYFDIISQSVFYALFYACPKSRDALTDEVKEDLLNEFCQLIGGVKITNPRKYFSNWYLDLGAGNILKCDDAELVEQKKLALPPIHPFPWINFKTTVEPKTVRTIQNLGCSPIVSKYLKTEQYQTRNYVRGINIRFSKLDYEPEEVEAIFQKYKEETKKIDTNLKGFKVQAKKDEKQLRTELKEMRDENWRHLRRLSRRRDEELANGAHEYANYLVSMLRANE